MNIPEIMKKHLKVNGYDGLYYDGECGCELSDLMPCGECPTRCLPGYKVLCNEECDHDYLYGIGNWHIQRDKPEVK